MSFLLLLRFHLLWWCHSICAICSSFIVSIDILINKFLFLHIPRFKNRKSLNLWKMYFQRFMRLSPCLALMILINDYLATTTLSLRQVPIGSYESASSLNYSVIPCRHYWWSAIFHIQNFVNPHELVSFLFLII